MSLGVFDALILAYTPMTYLVVGLWIADRNLSNIWWNDSTEVFGINPCNPFVSPHSTDMLKIGAWGPERFVLMTSMFWGFNAIRWAATCALLVVMLIAAVSADDRDRKTA